MNSEFLRSIADALGFSSTELQTALPAVSAECGLGAITHSRWTRNLGQLDRIGLTLPLYARLLESGNSTHLPRQTIAAFELRRQDNEVRMLRMLQTFGQAVEAFQGAGIRFVCLKGFSLFPDFHEELWQRHQVDFDFLIASGDGLRAQTALEALGYKLTAIAGDDERRMRIPVTRVLSRDAYIYQLQEGAAIELHSRFWESGAEDFPLTCPLEVLSQAQMHTVGTVSFPRLSLQHAFLYQLLHVFRHFLGSWARPLWVYEIANFLHRHRTNDSLWREICTLSSADPRMIDIAALVLLTAREVFACSIPQALEPLCDIPANSPIRHWVQHFARRWLLTDMPGNKLNLLLHRHFYSDDRVWRRYLVRRLVPRGQRPMLCEGLDEGVSQSLAYRIANLRYQTSRAWHHLHTGAGFLAAAMFWRSYPGMREELPATRRASRGVL